MSMVFTDAELDAWVQANGQVPAGYGAMVARIRKQERQYQDDLAELRKKLAAPDAPKLYFVPGRGLQDCPF